MRTGPVVASTLLLALAGCGSSLPLGSSTPTVTPAPTPTTPAEIVPGVTADGEISPARLASAHRDQLSASSYTLERTTAVTGGETLYWHRDHRVRADGRDHVYAETDYFTVFLVPVSGTANQQYWSNGSVTVDRTRTFAGREYVRAIDAPIPVDVTGHQFVLETVRAFDLRLVSQDDLRFVSEGIVGPTAMPMPGFVARPSNITATVEVSPNGIVRSIRLEYDAELLSRGQTFHVVDEFTVSKVGATSVERPDWAENVTVDEPPATTDANGTGA